MREEFSKYWLRLKDIRKLSKNSLDSFFKELFDRAKEYARLRRWKIAKTATNRYEIFSRMEYWEQVAVARPIIERYTRERAEKDSEIRYLKHMMKIEAQDSEVFPGEEWLHFKEILGSDYRTQGYGADSYARGRAEMVAIEMESFGVESRVIQETNPDKFSSSPSYSRWYIPTSNWKIEVKVAGEMDVDILRFKKIEFRKWLKMCLKKALNPSVFIPGTNPSDLLSAYRLDWQGNDIPLEQA